MRPYSLFRQVPPHKGQAMIKDMRSGNGPKPQPYNLAEDPAETKNLARENPEKLKELAAMLDQIAGGKITTNVSSAFIPPALR